MAMVKLAKSKVGAHFEKWHGHPAREITRKMRVPRQTRPLPNPSEINVYNRGEDVIETGRRTMH